MSELALVKENKLVLQDRASCLPPYILNVTKKDTVLDCCAAPGSGKLVILVIINRTFLIFPNKAIKHTNWLSGAKKSLHVKLIRSDLNFYQIEWSSSGLVILSSQNFKIFLKLTSRRNVWAKIEFFKKLFKPYQLPWSGVSKVLLDPSCSGSGMAHRRILQEKDDESRIEKLAQFQEKAIKKAMSFPNAVEISYSTCSVHRRVSFRS